MLYTIYTCTCILHTCVQRTVQYSKCTSNALYMHVHVHIQLLHTSYNVQYMYMYMYTYALYIQPMCMYNCMLYNVQYKHMYSTCSRVHTHLMLYNIYTCTSDSLYIQCTNYYNV